MNSIALNSDFLFSRAGKAQMSMAMVFSAVAIFHSLLLWLSPIRLKERLMPRQTQDKFLLDSATD
ncbi:hypothetical protein DMN57_28720 [Escherichia coli]|nr:hypothetical protein [Escherichia coli]